MTRALMAFSVMLRPHVELTELTLTDSASTLAASASASLHLLTLGDRLVADLDRAAREPDADVRSCTLALAPSMPWSSSVARACVDGEVGRRHLPGDTALEVEAEVEALDDQRTTVMSNSSTDENRDPTSACRRSRWRSRRGTGGRRDAALDERWADVRTCRAGRRCS